MKKINTFFKAVFSALAIIFCFISFASDAPTPGGTWKKADIHNLKKMSDGIIDERHRIWKPMGGDGIYFQSFTETDKQELAGRSIAE